MRYLPAIALTIAAVTAATGSQAQEDTRLWRGCDRNLCFGIDWSTPSLVEIAGLPAGSIADSGLTPLHYAARHCVSPAMLYALAEKGADFNLAEPGSGLTPLQTAIILCKSDTVRTMLSLGADPDIRNGSNGGNSLHLAIRRKRSSNIIRTIMASEIDLDAADDSGVTPLMMLVAGNRYSLVAHILNEGANPDLVDKKGYTTAHYAAQRGDLDLLRRLVDSGSRLDVASAEAGQTPLHYSVERGLDVQTAAVFARAGVDIDPVDRTGRTPLHYAAAKSSAEQIAALLALGADPNKSDAEGNTPLHYALLYNQDPQVVTALLRLGAEPNIPSADGVSPTFMALARPDGSLLLDELLDYGASLYALDVRRRTLLHSAVVNNQPQAAAQLMALGLNPRLQDVSGETPIDLFERSDIGEPARGMFVALIEEYRQQLENAQERIQRERELQAQLRLQQEEAQQHRQDERALQRQQIRNDQEGERRLKTNLNKQQRLQRDLDNLSEQGHNQKKEQLNSEIEQLKQSELSIRDRLQQISQEAEQRKQR